MSAGRRGHERKEGQEAPAAAAVVPDSAALKKVAMAFTFTMRVAQRAMLIATLPVCVRACERADAPAGVSARTVAGGETDGRTSEDGTFGADQQRGDKVRRVEALAAQRGQDSRFRTRQSMREEMGQRADRGLTVFVALAVLMSCTATDRASASSAYHTIPGVR